MSKPKFLSSAGVTPVKLVLIGVLAVVLLLVIVLQIPPSSSTASTEPTPSNDGPTRRNHSKPQNPTLQSEAPVTPVRRAWPEFSLQTVLAHDPFAPPAWTQLSTDLDDPNDDDTTDGNQQGTAMSNRQILHDLHANGVDMVMISNGDRLARIGQWELREGDRIGGFVVHQINADGVVLVEQEAP